MSRLMTMMKKPKTVEEVKSQLRQRYKLTKLASRCQTHTHEVWDLSNNPPELLFTEDKKAISRDYEEDDMRKLLKRMEKSWQRKITIIAVADWDKERYFVKIYNSQTGTFETDHLARFIKCGGIYAHTWTPWMMKKEEIKEPSHNNNPLLTITAPAPAPPPPPPPPPAPMAPPPVPERPPILFFVYRHFLGTNHYVRDRGAHIVSPNIDNIWVTADSTPFDAVLVVTVDYKKKRVIAIHYKSMRSAPNWISILPATLSTPLTLPLAYIDQIKNV